MVIKERFQYAKLTRETQQDGTRHYNCPVTGMAVPSVTTILSKTADKTALILWEQAVGKKRADRARDEGTALGTLMHTHIENHILGIERPKGNHLMRLQAARMADQIITKALPKVDEIWGQEVAMYFPGLYAGTTDLVGVHEGEEAIMDHKTAKKMRTRDMITDYMDQMAAYAIAHDEVYGTKIKKGVVFMVSRQLEFKEFILEGQEFEDHKGSFLHRLETFMG
jgi:hypothetical protein